MKFNPEPYQTLGREHLTEHPRAALFAGMGLGKTAIALSALAELKRSGGLRGALVLGPLRVMTLTWPEEAEKWDEFRCLRVANLRTKAGWAMMERGEADVYLLNYQSLPRLFQYLQTFGEDEPYPFDTVVFDESTMVKNHEAKRMKGRKVPVVRCRKSRRVVDLQGLAQFLRKVPKEPGKEADKLLRIQHSLTSLLDVRVAEIPETGLNHHLPRLTRRWILTGTPRPNSITELFGQFLVLDDGERLGRSFSAFQQAWMELKNPYDRFSWTPREGSERKIYSRISDVTLVLRSSDYLNIPDTVYEDVEVALPPCAAKDYATLEKELLLVIKQLKDGDEMVTASSAAVLLNKLAQVTGGAVYIDGEAGKREWREIHSAKIEALKRLVKRIKEPVLIATAFVHEQARIVEGLDGCHVWKDDLYDDWNKGKIKAICADPRSIGHGLNLQHGGRTVIWFTLTDSGEQYEQFNARVARKNQKGIPQVFHLLCPGTVDDVRLANLSTKESEQKMLTRMLSGYRRMLHGM